MKNIKQLYVFQIRIYKVTIADTQIFSSKIIDEDSGVISKCLLRYLIRSFTAVTLQHCEC